MCRRSRFLVEGRRHRKTHLKMHQAKGRGRRRGRSSRKGSRNHLLDLWIRRRRIRWLILLLLLRRRRSRMRRSQRALVMVRKEIKVVGKGKVVTEALVGNGITRTSPQTKWRS